MGRQLRKVTTRTPFSKRIQRHTSGTKITLILEIIETLRLELDKHTIITLTLWKVHVVHSGAFCLLISQHLQKHLRTSLLRGRSRKWPDPTGILTSRHGSRNTLSSMVNVT